MQHNLLFRQSENTMNGIRIFNDQTLPDSAFWSWMIKLESITGMELPTGPYTFWYGNSKALNNSSKYHDYYRFFSKLSTDNRKGFISKLQRNLILQHHNLTMFLKSYLLRYITSNTQATWRDLESQTVLMRIASRMSCTINCQRLWTLNDA